MIYIYIGIPILFVNMFVLKQTTTYTINKCSWWYERFLCIYNYVFVSIIYTMEKTKQKQQHVPAEHPISLDLTNVMQLVILNLKILIYSSHMLKYVLSQPHTQSLSMHRQQMQSLADAMHSLLTRYLLVTQQH